MIDKLKVIGPFKGITGYDHHTREFVRHLLRAGVRVQLENLDGWSVELPPKQREAMFEELVADVGADTVLHFTMPHQARIDPNRRHVNFSMFEADRIPRDWVRHAVGHARVVLPTESSRSAWAKSGVPDEKLRLCPLGVDGAFFATPSNPRPLRTTNGHPVASFRHRFLHVAEWRPRKNLLGLLRAWVGATRSDDDAVLILKITVSERDVVEELARALVRMESRLECSLEEAGPICVIAEPYTREQIRSLYQSATHCISMSLGEGWDLVMMEAAAAGLRLIAPRHSAYLSYLTDDDAELIASTPVAAKFEGPRKRDERIFFEGSSWWQPDERAAAQVIRGIIDGTRAPKRSPSERIRERYSWENATRRLMEILDELG